MAQAARQVNTAYNPAPRRRDKGPQLHELPLVRPRRGSAQQIHSRVRVHLRQPDKLSVLPVLGLLLAGMMCVMIITGYSKLNGIYAETVKLRDQLNALELEGKTLSAQYEETFDKAALEAAIANSGSTLSEVKSSQRVYVDLSEEDNVLVYKAEGTGLLQRIRNLFTGSGS